MTNPIANGVPARLVPPELLVQPRSDLSEIPLTWLRRKPTDLYRLAKGDILGVYIEGVLGEEDQVPPVHFPQLTGQVPSIGFPIPIRENGTVPLPLIDPVDVAGLTLDEAQEKIVEAYTETKKIIRPDEARAIVTLITPRVAKVLVIREDTTQQAYNEPQINIFSRAAPIIPPRQEGRGFVLDLPATEADLLTALAKSGGMPGPNAADEIIIQRGYGTTKVGTMRSWVDITMSCCGARPRTQMRRPVRWRFRCSCSREHRRHFRPTT